MRALYKQNKKTVALPIMICAVTGILIGGLFYGIQSNIENLDKALSHSSQIANTELFKKMFSIIFNLDVSNPLSILKSNSPVFGIYEEEAATENISEKVHTPSSAVSESNSSPQASSNNAKQQFIEDASCIVFEGDVENEEIKNNPMVSSGEIQIINQTSYTIDIDKLLKEPLKIKPDKKNSQIFIYHTHTTESFLKDLNDKTVDSRTYDNKYNVVRVGEELTKNLKKYNIGVVHNTAVHDADYNSSYANSLKTLSANLKNNPKLKLTIDLHRDAMGDEKLRVVRNINGKDVARIMFVIGTDQKLENPGWKENLKLALKVQKRLNEIAPGLAKPIYISQNRYNQHLTNGSVIIEIGGDGNTISECVASTKYLAQAINDVIY